MSPTRRGFTLLELLVVIMITGVITGLSMGRVSNILAHERIASASIRLSNELRQGFAIPGRLRRPVRIVVDTVAMQLLITDRAQTTTFVRAQIGGAHNLTSANVAYYPSTPLEVYPNGFASDTMVLTLKAGEFSRRITVSRGGMVQVRAL